MDIYKYAAVRKVKFATPRGYIGVEDLFDLPLKAKDNFSLDGVARTINAALKASGEESFVDDTPNPAKKHHAILLDIVKDVIATKQAEAAAAQARAHRATERRKILDAMDAKREEKLSKASLAQLEKQLAALEDEDPVEVAE